jgi:hypothetical protein
MAASFLVRVFEGGYSAIQTEPFAVAVARFKNYWMAKNAHFDASFPYVFEYKTCTVRIPAHLSIRFDFILT